MKNIIRAVPFLLLLLFAFFIFTEKTEIPPEETVSLENQDESNSLSVAPQAPGSQVVIQSVQIDRPGYIALYRQSGELPQPEDIIGVSQLLTESQENLVIELEGETVSGEVLTAILHGDDGDGEFVFPGSDEPITGADGGVVSAAVLITDENTDQFQQLPPIAE